MWKKYADRGRAKSGGGRRRNKKSYDGDMDSFLSDTVAAEMENRPKTAAEVSKEMVAQGTIHHSYAIGGIKIKFPAKPYPSQFSMMDKIIRGLDKSQNSLLESPTGSGKSLALLCSSLAWQQAQKAKIEKENQESRGQNDCCCSCHRHPEADTSEYFSSAKALFEKTPVPVTPTTPGAVLDDSQRDEFITEEDDDFKMPSKSFRDMTTPGGRKHITIEYDHGRVNPHDPDVTLSPDRTTFERGAESPCHCLCYQDKPVKKVPKIYFGTRTHKQIAQIARELAKTEYRDVRMCILASREHTCIDPEVSKNPKKTEECKNKRDGPGCRFFDNVRKVTHTNIEVNGLDLAWDLEDFVLWNRRHNSCPYYGSRQLKEDADVVFCPYNYLIDPTIRQTMEIHLKGQIVIIDEAHNIEDSARESASFSATQPEMSDSMKDLEKMMDLNSKYAEHLALKNMLMSLNDIIDNFKDSLGADNYDQANRVWSGMEMVVQLQNAQLGPDQVKALVKQFKIVAEEDPNERLPLKLPAACLSLLEGFFMVLEYIYREDMKYMNDYRVALVRTMAYTYNNQAGGWKGKNRRGSLAYLFTLHFWCMNPAVAFSDLHDVKSIILTSGTLSPMTSFQSELGQPFPIQLEASHVINSKQVWVGSISKGPRGGNLLGSYQHTETLQYQDELGQLVAEVCKMVPHGVLCFTTSYKMIEKLVNRWQTTGLYQDICKYKRILREPRGADKDKVDFDELLRHFYTIIKDTEHADRTSGEVTGALFLAVCRGKVSEGMDFADNNARAVITVGIPFPNVMDTQIGLKRKYNNEHSGPRGLLTGSDWYEIQAYRALNQALGRCIRHRYDWGALILVDERFGKNPAKYTKGLSKWVRQKVQFFGNFFQAQRSLQEFTDHMIASPPGPSSDQSLSVSQMDMSVAVETLPSTPRVGQNRKPNTSPSPPILPPASSTGTSPPLDINQSNIHSSPANATLQPSALTTGEAQYVLGSQAGGFLHSQNQTLGAPTQHPLLSHPTQGSHHITNHYSSTQVSNTQFANQTIVSGSAATQQMVLNDTIHFKPPFSSTQATQRHSAFEPASTNTQITCTLTSGDLTFEPGSTSTQIDGINGMEKIKSDFRGASVGFNAEPKAKQKHNKTKKEDDPPYEPTLAKCKKLRNSAKHSSNVKMTQLVDLTVVDDDEDINIDERSSSPLLFDSDERIDKDFQNKESGNPNLNDFSSIDEVKIGGVQKHNTVQRKPLFSNKKPLFDSNKGLDGSGKTDLTTAGSGVRTCADPYLSENIMPEVSRSQRPTRGRLSRRKSADQDQRRASCDETKETSKTNTSIRMLSGSGRRPTKGVVYDDHDGHGDDEPKVGQDDDFKPEGLNKRRSSRSKRRRLSSHETSNTSANDILDGIQNAKEFQVSCMKCSENLTTPQGFLEEELPGYIKSVLPSGYQFLSGSVLTGDAKCIDTKICRPISASSKSGLQLNSIWSEEVGCCLRFLSCCSQKCKSNSDVISAVIVMGLSDRTDARYKNQVWFLPTQCTKTKRCQDSTAKT